jgi:phosphatidylserine synthase 2
VLFDIFVLPHAFGWICGQLLLRNWKMSWLLSIAFEFYELTFAHWLRNFDECWWDHVLVDVLICNAFGIYVGGRLLERWGLQVRRAKFAPARINTIDSSPCYAF